MLHVLKLIRCSYVKCITNELKRWLRMERGLNPPVEKEKKTVDDGYWLYGDTSSIVMVLMRRFNVFFSPSTCV